MMASVSTRRRSKAVAMGAVALMVAMAAVMFVPSDDSDAASTVFASAKVDNGDSVDLVMAEAVLQKTGSATMIAKNGFSVGSISLKDSSGSTVSASSWSYTVSDGKFLFNSGSLSAGTYTLELGAMKGSQVLCYYSIAVNSPVTLNVSDMTVYAGQAISITPVTSGTVSVSGVGWLSASGNCVYGTAPAENGTYTVTVSCGGSSASFRITVISALAFSSVPSSGVFAYEG